MELVRKSASSSGNGGELDNSASQTIGGAKTFSGAVTAASTLTSTGAFTPTGGIVGKTDGSAVAAGMVGENFSDSVSTFFTTSPTTIISRLLQPGVWRLTAYTNVNSGTGPTNIYMSISTTANTQNAATGAYAGITTGVGLAALATELIVNISSAQTYHVVGQSGGAAVNNLQTTRLFCVRIA